MYDLFLQAGFRNNGDIMKWTPETQEGKKVKKGDESVKECFGLNFQSYYFHMDTHNKNKSKGMFWFKYNLMSEFVKYQHHDRTLERCG